MTSAVRGEMDRSVVRVDRVLLASLALHRAPEAAAALAGIERSFLKAGGDGGKYAVKTDGWRREAWPAVQDEVAFDSLSLEKDGLLTGKIEVHDVPGMDWTKGTLSIWRSTFPVPDAVLATATGRRLGELVSHPLLPTDMTIESVEAGDPWIRVRCGDWNVPVEKARGLLAAADDEAGRRKT